jgi:hypothetical protein
VKDLAVYNIRVIGRRSYLNFRKTLRQNWDETPADYYCVIHGSNSSEVDPDVENAKREGAKFHVLNLGTETRGEDLGIPRPLISRCILRLFRHAHGAGYKYVCFLDDDAYFPEPSATLTHFRSKMIADKKIGVIGPTGQFRQYYTHGIRNSEKGKYSAFEITRRPWATFGCQMYRVSAVINNPKIMKLEGLGFRADVFMFIMVNEAGYRCEEIVVPFSHSCSRFSLKKPPPYDLLMSQYPRIYGLLKKTFHERYHRDLDGMLRDEMKKFKKAKEGSYAVLGR